MSVYYKKNSQTTELIAGAVNKSSTSTFDEELSTVSENAVQNKVVTIALNEQQQNYLDLRDDKQDKELSTGLTINGTAVSTVEDALSEIATISNIDTAVDISSDNVVTNSAIATELLKYQTVMQVDTLPAASIDNLGQIYQYEGATTASLTSGYFYRCEYDGTNYNFNRIDVQPLPVQELSALPATPEHYVYIVDGHYYIKGTEIATATGLAEKQDKELESSIMLDDGTELETVEAALSHAVYEVDDALDSTSAHPVENQVVTEALNNRLSNENQLAPTQSALTAVPTVLKMVTDIKYISVDGAAATEANRPHSLKQEYLTGNALIAAIKSLGFIPATNALLVYDSFDDFPTTVISDATHADYNTFIATGQRALNLDDGEIYVATVNLSSITWNKNTSYNLLATRIPTAKRYDGDGSMWVQ